MKCQPKTFVSSYGLTVFLIATILLFFIFPIIMIFDGGAFSFKIFFTGVSISCVFLVSKKLRDTVIAFLLALGGMSMTLSRDTLEYSALEIGGLISYFLLYVFAIIILIRHMRAMTIVNYQTIAGAICIYLLLGLLWSFMYLIIELLFPHSFNGLYSGQGVEAGNLAEVFSHLFYYSYVTLTTLGYGSISPRTILASAFSSAQAVVGQLYIAIVIARLVSLFTSQELVRKNNYDEK